MKQPVLFQAVNFDWEGHYDPNTVDDFAYLNPRAFGKIFPNPKSRSKMSECEGYIRLRNRKRKIYLKYKGASVVGLDKVMLSYQNLSFLGAVPRKGETNSSIAISPSSYFAYKFCNQNSEIRWAFIISIVSILLSCLSIIYTIVK